MHPHPRNEQLQRQKQIAYMPGAFPLAATHHGKVKNIKLSTLRDTHMTCDPRSSILLFEKESTAYDNRVRKETRGTSVRHLLVLDYEQLYLVLLTVHYIIPYFS